MTQKKGREEERITDLTKFGNVDFSDHDVRNMPLDIFLDSKGRVDRLVDYRPAPNKKLVKTTINIKTGKDDYEQSGSTSAENRGRTRTRIFRPKSKNLHEQYRNRYKPKQRAVPRPTQTSNEKTRPKQPPVFPRAKSQEVISMGQRQARDREREKPFEYQPYSFTRCPFTNLLARPKFSSTSNLACDANSTFAKSRSTSRRASPEKFSCIPYKNSAPKRSLDDILADLRKEEIKMERKNFQVREQRRAKSVVRFEEYQKAQRSSSTASCNTTSSATTSTLDSSSIVNVTSGVS